MLGGHRGRDPGRPYETERESQEAVRGTVSIGTFLSGRVRQQRKSVQFMATVGADLVTSLSLIFFTDMRLMSSISSGHSSRSTTPFQPTRARSRKSRTQTNGSRFASLCSGSRSLRRTRERQDLLSHYRNHSNDCSSIRYSSRTCCTTQTQVPSSTRVHLGWWQKWR